MGSARGEASLRCSSSSLGLGKDGKKTLECGQQTGDIIAPSLSSAPELSLVTLKVLGFTASSSFSFPHKSMSFCSSMRTGASLAAVKATCAQQFSPEI